MTDYGLVSIITPAYNSALFIEETIRSIVAQTYTNWELLITDDCSKDNTCNIIERYAQADPRIKLFRQTENAGAGVARNRSIKEAQGRFIAFCDSDDCWKPEKLERQLSFMAATGTEICDSSYMKFDEKGKILGVVVARKAVDYRDIVHNDWMGFLTCIYDTQRIGKVYLPSLRRRQDWAWKILLMQKCPKAQAMIDVLAYYRIRQGSLSNKKLRLVRYNVAVYRQVLRYNTLHAWLMFLFVFFPNYLLKEWRQKIINI